MIMINGSMFGIDSLVKIELIVGQFGTESKKTDNLAPGQFGTRTIWHRTIWHQDKKSEKNAFFCNFSQNQVPYFSGNVALFEVPDLF